MSNVSKKKLSLPTVQQPAARWAFVLAVCAALGVVVSYCWRVFYGLDARGVSAAGVTGLCVGLAVLAGSAALALIQAAPLLIPAAWMAVRAVREPLE